MPNQTKIDTDHYFKKALENQTTWGTGEDIDYHLKTLEVQKDQYSLIGASSSSSQIDDLLQEAQRSLVQQKISQIKNKDPLKRFLQKFNKLDTNQKLADINNLKNEFADLLAQEGIDKGLGEKYFDIILKVIDSDNKTTVSLSYLENALSDQFKAQKVDNIMHLGINLGAQSRLIRGQQTNEGDHWVAACIKFDEEDATKVKMIYQDSFGNPPPDYLLWNFKQSNQLSTTYSKGRIQQDTIKCAIHTTQNLYNTMQTLSNGQNFDREFNIIAQQIILDQDSSEKKTQVQNNPGLNIDLEFAFEIAKSGRDMSLEQVKKEQQTLLDRAKESWVDKTKSQKADPKNLQKG